MSRRLLIGGALAAVVGSAALVVALQRPAGVDEGRALEERARAALEAGEPEEALKQLDELARREPRRAGLEGLRGRALTSAGSPVEALPLLTAAAVANPTDVEALEFNAVALAQLGRYAEAKDFLLKAIAINRSQSRLWRRLAQLRLVTQEVPGAVEAWQEAQRAAPREAAEIELEARTLLLAGGFTELAGRFGADGG